VNILIVAVSALSINIILGKYRARFKKMTIMWWVMIHASIPLIIPLRIWLDTPKIAIPLFIGLAITGQLIGSRLLLIKKK
jgi:hypothetical protein